MTNYEIEFMGEEGLGSIYEGVILWERGYFVIHSINGVEKKGYIPLTAIKKIIEVEENSEQDELSAY